MFTICRHLSRVVAFLQAVVRPKFRGPRSASIARSQVWLGLPISRFQSSGTCRIAAARAPWWSSRDELRAIWPKSRRCLLVTWWESGEQPVVPLTSAFDTWRVYGILEILRGAHVSNASRQEQVLCVYTPGTNRCWGSDQFNRFQGICFKGTQYV